MRKIFVYRMALVTVVLLFFTGCAQKMTVVSDAYMDIPLDEKGTVYFYTPKTLSQKLHIGTPITATDSNGSKNYLGKVGTSSYITYYAKPGRIKFSNLHETIFGDNAVSSALTSISKVMTTDMAKDVIINVEAGKKYCIHAEMFTAVVLTGYGGVFQEESVENCEKAITALNN